ncbi:ATP-binding cassette domain-containing protein [candidate division WOR-3 bacterium]|nr:ATP-binding cassette domain-containing protein [candidate division WOR-3 bacterium]
MIEFVDVSFPPVFKDFSFRIEKGEFFILVGKTGAGKTTTIRLASFEITPKRGEVMVMGMSSRRISIQKRLFVFKKSGLFLDKPVLFENYSLIRNLLFVTDGRDRAYDSLKIVGLLEKKDLTTSRLSRGERDLLQLAILYAKRPILAMLDEPTVNLKDKKWEIMEMLAGLHRRGTTILMTTKDEEVVNRFPNNRIFML